MVRLPPPGTLCQTQAVLELVASIDLIDQGRYRLVEGDFMTMEPPESGFDLVLSLMVMEHVEDDARFAARVVELVRPGGTVIIGVPARM